MQIFRSALSCCVLTGLSHEVIRRFCMSRVNETIANASDRRHSPSEEYRITAQMLQESLGTPADDENPADVDEIDRFGDDNILMEEMD